jgi:hypothetical protein
MSIFNRLSNGIALDLIVGDNLLTKPGASAYTRIAVSAFSLHNTTGASVVIDIYESPDATSGGGKVVAQYNLGANESASVLECLQGYKANEDLVAVPDAVGVNAKITFSGFDGSS